MNAEIKSSARKNQSRLFIYIPTDLYKVLKSHCKDQDSTITKYVARAIVMRLNLEKEIKDKIKW